MRWRALRQALPSDTQLSVIQKAATTIATADKKRNMLRRTSLAPSLGADRRGSLRVACDRQQPRTVSATEASRRWTQLGQSSHANAREQAPSRGAGRARRRRTRAATGRIDERAEQRRHDDDRHSQRGVAGSRSPRRFARLPRARPRRRTRPFHEAESTVATTGAERRPPSAPPAAATPYSARRSRARSGAGRSASGRRPTSARRRSATIANAWATPKTAAASAVESPSSSWRNRTRKTKSAACAVTYRLLESSQRRVRSVHGTSWGSTPSLGSSRTTADPIAAVVSDAR